MARLSTLFNYQKIAKNTKLQNIIDEVDNKYSLNNRLDDRELELVSAGIERGPVQFSKIACPKCSAINNVNILANFYICGACGARNNLNG